MIALILMPPGSASSSSVGESLERREPTGQPSNGQRRRARLGGRPITTKQPATVAALYIALVAEAADQRRTATLD